MSFRQGFRSFSAKRRRTVSRETLWRVVSRASSPAKSSKVQRERPAGGLEQAVATSKASSLPVSLRRAPGRGSSFSAAAQSSGSLSGSFQTAPTFWLDPRNGVSYNISTQTPEYRSDSLQKLENIPVTGPATAQSGILADLASFSRGSEMAVVSHYNVEPVIDIFGSVHGRDLGGVARDITPILNRNRKDLPRGSQINILGQIDTMNQSFVGLLSGIWTPILLVYLLIVVNFQSWLDPFIIRWLRRRRWPESCGASSSPERRSASPR